MGLPVQRLQQALKFEQCRTRKSDNLSTVINRYDGIHFQCIDNDGAPVITAAGRGTFRQARIGSLHDHDLVRR